MATHDIDWTKMCKPQPNQYDSVVLCQLLKDKYGWARKKPVSDITLCDGVVDVVADRFSGATVNGGMIDGLAYCTPERMSGIDKHLAQWQDGYEAMKHFLDELWPKWSLSQRSEGHGSSSGHHDIKTYMAHYPTDVRGVVTAVNVTVNNIPGCGNGMYHELGHVRMETMGIGVEWNDCRLLLNPSTEMYDSPIRRDKLRPMSAVVQAIYSWLMLTESDLHAAHLAPHVKIPVILWNVPKIIDGIHEIKTYGRFTDEGKQFFDTYFDWADDLVARGIAIGKEHYGSEFENQWASAKQYKTARSTTREELAVLEESARRAIAEGRIPDHQK